MQSLQTLIDYLYLGVNVFGSQQCGYASGNLFVGKGSIELLHVILHPSAGMLFLPLGIPIGARDDILHLPFLQQADSSLECDELFQVGHVDAIVIGIAHLGRG